MKVRAWPILITFGLIVGLPFIRASTAHADTNYTLEGGTQRKTQGSTYWITSSLREWLNSDADAGNVTYTDNAPTYKNEAGFLNAFTSTEQNEIATVKHRVYINQSDYSTLHSHGLASGSLGYGSTYMVGQPTIEASYSNELNQYGKWYYTTTNDKVYIPTIDEVYRLEEARGINIQKTLTSEAMTKTQYTNASQPYWLNTNDDAMASSEADLTVTADSTNVLGRTTASTTEGVVPAIWLKPTAKVNNTTANKLTIGDTVEFGSYLGKAISWTVVNSDNGYQMLIANHILDMKQFDATGDYSDSVSKTTFTDSDLDITDMPVAAKDGSSNTTVPHFTLSNASDVTSRQNSSYTLHLKGVTEDGTTLDHIVLPDGSTTTSSTVDYKVTENKAYTFWIYDSSGNVGSISIPVNNINPASSVLITPSTTGWTNKAVSVSILANNSVGTSWASQSMYSSRDKGLYNFPNYTTYSGKKIHVKFTLNGGTPTSTNTSILNSNVALMLYYKSMVLDHNQYVLRNQWVTAYNSPLWAATPYSSIMNGNSKTIEATFAVPDNYNSSLSTNMHMDIQYDDYNYPYSITNFEVDLVDNDDFKIKSITLPSGKVIDESSYTDTLDSDGTYTYSVLDSRGYTTSKTITVKIDKIAPSLSLDSNNTVVSNKPVTINATGTDSGGSGVAAMESPLGEWISGSSYSYTVDTVGKHNYTFGVKDNAGNVTNKTVTVDYDITPPTLSISGNPTSDVHHAVTLTATGSDDDSGVSEIQTPDGTWHSGSTVDYKAKYNGTYTFKIKDNAGNISTKTVTVDKITPQSAVTNDAVTTSNSDEAILNNTIKASYNKVYHYLGKTIVGSPNGLQSLQLQTSLNKDVNPITSSGSISDQGIKVYSVADDGTLTDVTSQGTLSYTNQGQDVTTSNKSNTTVDLDKNRLVTWTATTPSNFNGQTLYMDVPVTMEPDSSKLSDYVSSDGIILSYKMDAIENGQTYSSNNTSITLPNIYTAKLYKSEFNTDDTIAGTIYLKLSADAVGKISNTDSQKIVTVTAAGQTQDVKTTLDGKDKIIPITINSSTSASNSSPTFNIKIQSDQTDADATDIVLTNSDIQSESTNATTLTTLTQYTDKDKLFTASNSAAQYKTTQSSGTFAFVPEAVETYYTQSLTDDQTAVDNESQPMYVRLMELMNTQYQSTISAKAGYGITNDVKLWYFGRHLNNASMSNTKFENDDLAATFTTDDDLTKANDKESSNISNNKSELLNYDAQTQSPSDLKSSVSQLSSAKQLSYLQTIFGTSTGSIVNDTLSSGNHMLDQISSDGTTYKAYKTASDDDKSFMTTIDSDTNSTPTSPLLYEMDYKFNKRILSYTNDDNNGVEYYASKC